MNIGGNMKDKSSTAYSEELDFVSAGRLLETEEKLTHLLREAGRYLHPGPREKVSQKEILSLLYRHPGLTQKVLSEKLHKTPAAVSEILRKLDRAGLVERTPNENDRRVFDLNLTEKGKQSILEYEQERNQDNDLYGILSETELNDLYQLLDKLIGFWHETRKVHEPAPPKGPHPKPPKPPKMPDPKRKN